MNGATGLRIAIGDEAPPPGFQPLRVRTGANGNVRVNEGLPFPDRAADVILCDETTPGLTGAPPVALLLECRRVLKPQGIFRVAVRRRESEVPPSNVSDVTVARGAANDEATSELLRLAALVGLEPTDRAPVAPHCRAAIAALPSGEGDSTLLEFTKRDRRLDGDPLVSILIPSSRERYFVACLESAFAQTYQNVEIIVRDDSQDYAIEDMIHALAKGRPVDYERNPEPLGVRGNHRRCLESARGEFVKFLCDDDVLAPTCVARLLDAFRKAPDVTLATSHRQLIDFRGEKHPDQPMTLPIVERDSVIAGYTLVHGMLASGLNVVGEPTTTLFRKTDFMDEAPHYFRFNGVDGHGVIDMVMWSMLMMKGDAVYLRDSLSSFRVHRGQRQQDPAKKDRNMDSIRGLQSAWLALGLHDSLSHHPLLAKPFPPPAAIG